MYISILLTISLLFTILWKFHQRPKNFPPGPKGIPLLGYIPFLPRTPTPLISAFPKLTTYNPVVGIYIGPFQPVVIVSGLKAVTEALNNEDLDGRPNTKAIRDLTFGETLGIAANDGEPWREQRAFTKRKLKELVLDKRTLEDRATSEILALMKEINLQSQSNGDVVDFENLFFAPVINVLWGSLCGERLRRDDEKTRHVLETAIEFNKKASFEQFLFRIPDSIVRFLRLRPEELICNLTDVLKPLQTYIMVSIREHQVRRQSPYYSSWDFIDHYLDELDGRGNESSFSVEQLGAILKDLFVAGSDTTSNQIGFSLILLINNPDVQRRVQEELDEVCGDRLPSLDDRNRLPFTEAVLFECSRVSPASFTVLPHRAMKDTYLQNYFIPKDSVVILQVREGPDGAKYWSDPETFRPDRYLEFSNGSYRFAKKETFLPFGSGKRMCLGESMGKAMYFLFVSALLKNFEFRPIPNEPPPTSEARCSMIPSYYGFKALAIPRRI